MKKAKWKKCGGCDRVKEEEGESGWLAVVQNHQSVLQWRTQTQISFSPVEAHTARLCRPTAAPERNLLTDKEHQHPAPMNHSAALFFHKHELLIFPSRPPPSAAGCRTCSRPGLHPQVGYAAAAAQISAGSLCVAPPTEAE